MENIALREQRAIFKKLLEVGNVAALNEHDRAQYECNLKHCAVFMSQLEYAEKQGEDRGIEKGIEKGREEGLVAGMEKGILLTASTMKNRGIAASVIADCTGLSINQIENL
jgi:predicted transposase/invertase (TIGR01784 family)